VPPRGVWSVPESSRSALIVSGRVSSGVTRLGPESGPSSPMCAKPRD
jgi:hypothetical protein